MIQTASVYSCQGFFIFGIFKSVFLYVFICHNLFFNTLQLEIISLVGSETNRIKKKNFNCLCCLTQNKFVCNCFSIGEILELLHQFTTFVLLERGLQNHFFGLHSQKQSATFMGKRKQASNCSKRFLSLENLLMIITRCSITSQKLGFIDKL